MNLDRWLVLPRIVDNLADEGRQLVDRETRPALFLAASPDIHGPLLAQPREADIVERAFAVLGFALGDELEGIFGVFEDVVIRGHEKPFEWNDNVLFDL